MIARPTQFGFSLVELSIVLVILGLLTGGILGGQALIRAAELRAVSTEYNRWVTATQTFKDKYFALPGDMSNATSFWGKNATDCNANTGTAATPGTCNGNGDGMVSPNAASATGEMFQFWKQLALGGLIEGTYSGLAGGGAAMHTIPGTNAPFSKMSNSGWATRTYNAPGDISEYRNDFGNGLFFGTATTNNMPLIGNLKPEEAWNIDTKMDDGKPARGKVWVRMHNFTWGDANSCTTSTSNADYTGDYRLNATGQVCAMWFANAY